MKTYRCQFCKYSVSENKANKGIKSAKYKMGHHYETIHRDLIPENMSGYKWFYFILTKRESGSCVECKGPTEFNNINMKYIRFCDNPLCKQKYREEAKKRMIKKYGKIHILDSPEQQKKMMANRRIAGVYTWSDQKTKFTYIASYELDFLRYLDNELKWPSDDILWPSPHTYEYVYNGETHFYIPDGFIPSISCEIEIKDDGSAKNINQVSREKDKIKDELMRSNANYFKYIKIVNKRYDEFVELIKGD